MSEQRTTSLSPLLTVTEAAEYLRSGVSTLNKLRVYGGGPPFVKINSSVRYRRVDLDRFIEKRLQKSTAEGKAA
jgi:excisionase family DNA binding protein